MKKTKRSISKLFMGILSPILIPIYAVCLYFILSKHHLLANALIRMKLILSLILLGVLPLLFWFLLKSLRLWEVNKYRLKKTGQRLFILFLGIIFFVVSNFILGKAFTELFYFFTGILLTLITLLFLSFSPIAPSLSISLSSALLGYLISMSLLHQYNVLIYLLIMVTALGIMGFYVIRERGYSIKEVGWGAFFGIFPQLLFSWALLAAL